MEDGRWVRYYSSVTRPPATLSPALSGGEGRERGRHSVWISGGESVLASRRRFALSRQSRLVSSLAPPGLSVIQRNNFDLDAIAAQGAAQCRNAMRWPAAFRVQPGDGENDSHGEKLKS
jgi:hypothetical protein